MDNQIETFMEQTNTTPKQEDNTPSAAENTSANSENTATSAENNTATVEELQEQLTQTIATALAREQKQQAEIADLKKTINDLKTAHETALKAKEQEVSMKAFKLAIKEYGKASQDGKIPVETSAETLRERYEAIKNPKARREFVKGLSKVDFSKLF